MTTQNPHNSALDMSNNENSVETQEKQGTPTETQEEKSEIPAKAQDKPETPIETQEEKSEIPDQQIAADEAKQMENVEENAEENAEKKPSSLDTMLKEGFLTPDEHKTVKQIAADEAKQMENVEENGEEVTGVEPTEAIGEEAEKESEKKDRISFFKPKEFLNARCKY